MERIQYIDLENEPNDLRANEKQSGERDKTFFFGVRY